MAEAVAWMLEWVYDGERHGQRLYDDERHCLLDAESDGGVCTPLVRLADYEALRKRCEAVEAALRTMTGAAYPVCTSIDPRGYKWCEPYLDQALPDARQAIAAAQEPSHG